MFYAHTRPGAPPEQWEPLEDHLRRTAELAASHAAAFEAADWGALLGWWHDLGKYSSAFQEYLLACGSVEDGEHTGVGRVDHSTAGAQHAARQLPRIGRLLAYCIAGHHGGLPDNRATHGASGLADRLQKAIPATAAAPAELLDRPEPALPSMDFRHDNMAFSISFFARMLFSCLVDADYIATEYVKAPERSAARRHAMPSIARLHAVLDAHLNALQRQAAKTPVNRKRSQVLEACRAAAEQPPGLFSLTVPTGGGKTLSSLAFGLKHAALNGQRRVIYAIPYTSIIEQNAEVFRAALKAAGAEIVLEHHSNFEPDKDRDGVMDWSRFAAENWDAPVVVTTNVQFYESLFASKTSRCRKLHNIARSVIILDEAQSLPVKLLRPTLALLAELARNYGCTVVLCSATQPTVAKRDGFEAGLANVREIVPDPAGLFDALRRVEVERLGDRPLGVEDLAPRLAGHKQVLCIVNTRPHARALFEALGDSAADGLYHLSAQMCPQHRSVVLWLIRRRLCQGLPCRVISTQLIEAGVDIDFPVVYRAMSGLDSIAQAAGRCNREGRLSTPGEVCVFNMEIPRQMQDTRIGADKTKEVWTPDADALGLDTIRAFFELYYWQRKSEWDEHSIMGRFSVDGEDPHFQYKQVARDYRIIDDDQRAVIVPFDRRGRRLIEALTMMRHPPGRDFARKLQRYAIGVRECGLRKLMDAGAITLYHEQYYVVENASAYDRQLGLTIDCPFTDPESLIA
jgi:CRISPR-associated endonuclease/helicase Cas3